MQTQFFKKSVMGLTLAAMAAAPALQAAGLCEEYSVAKHSHGNANANAKNAAQNTRNENRLAAVLLSGLSAVSSLGDNLRNIILIMSPGLPLTPVQQAIVNANLAQIIQSSASLQDAFVAAGAQGIETLHESITGFCFLVTQVLQGLAPVQNLSVVGSNIQVTLINANPILVADGNEIGLDFNDFISAIIQFQIAVQNGQFAEAFAVAQVHQTIANALTVKIIRQLLTTLPPA